MTDGADRVFYNGTIHTLDGRGTVTTAIATRGNRILATGDDAAMRSLAASSSRETNLRGRTVIPGLIDSHNHMLSTGLNADYVDLSRANNLGDVLTAIADRAGATGDAWVVTSSRWHESQLSEGRFPTRDELDTAAGAPTIVRRGGHNVVANSVALQRAGIDDATPDPPGGTYVRDAGGRLTGHVIGAPAYSRLTRLLPEPTEAQRQAAIGRTCQLYNAAGLTGVIEPGLTAPELRAYQTARAAGRLTVRTTLMPRLTPGTTEDTRDRALAELRALPLLTGFGDEMLKLGGIKLVADGGVETNFLREPYAHADDPASPNGKPQISPDNLAAVCTVAAELGWQMGVHCVGDAAIDMVLAAFAAADRRRSIAALRWTLIHMILARPEHFESARRLQLCVAAQQPLIYALGAGWVRYWGRERAHAALPLAAIARSELPVGGGSDSPVTPYQPLLGIWSSVTRATQLAGQLGPEWAISPADALAWYTRGSAYLCFAEHERGSLEPGKLADLVVLSADPLQVPLDEIKDITVEETIIGGGSVFDTL